MRAQRGLSAGIGRDRLRLFDDQYRLLWDSATDTTPPYQHISDHAKAIIDYADGRPRWSGILFRTPAGIQREQHDLSYLNYMITWVNPLHDTAFSS